MPTTRSGPNRTRWFSARYGIVPVWAIILVVVLGATLITYASWPRTAVKAEPRTVVTGNIRIATLGDSITIGGGTDLTGEPNTDRSWVRYAVGHGVTWKAGFAHRGFTTAMILGQTKRYDVDVLVILAGTNDTLHGVPFATSAASLKAIVAEAGVARVIVSSIPPQDAAPEAAISYNKQLRALASRRGWDYVDATKALRRADVYIPKLTLDGIHPTPAGAKLLGQALHRAIVAEARR
jgi:lysophospholipase L1-like esterase